MQYFLKQICGNTEKVGSYLEQIFAGGRISQVKEQCFFLSYIFVIDNSLF